MDFNKWQIIPEIRNDHLKIDNREAGNSSAGGVKIFFGC
ncbi:hypothetical protein BA6E_103204 [Bacteroidales bacterium 6E]|nr:hypothetical protein BA6E_103204 [Bacteroidales bacterium 6E]